MFLYGPVQNYLSETSMIHVDMLPALGDDNVKLGLPHGVRAPLGNTGHVDDDPWEGLDDPDYGLSLIHI